MIVRAILENPQLADGFDYFNDHDDTAIWLRCFRGTAKEPQANEALQRLSKGLREWKTKRMVEAQQRGGQ